jgi:hypothetical protein
MDAAKCMVSEADSGFVHEFAIGGGQVHELGEYQGYNRLALLIVLLLPFSSLLSQAQAELLSRRRTTTTVPLTKLPLLDFIGRATLLPLTRFSSRKMSVLGPAYKITSPVHPTVAVVTGPCWISLKNGILIAATRMLWPAPTVSTRLIYLVPIQLVFLIPTSQTQQVKTGLKIRIPVTPTDVNIYSIFMHRPPVPIQHSIMAETGKNHTLWNLILTV